MTAHKITPTTSLFSNVAGVPAFSPATTPGTDSLTVDDGGYIVATGSLTQAADLAGPGAWTVNVNGSIFANTGFGLWLRSGTANSTVTIGATGEVGSGATTGIYMEDSGSIKNAGTISGSTAIYFFGGAKHALTNSGTIVGNILGSAGAITLTNSGMIDGDIFNNTGVAKITNTGTIAGDVSLGGGNHVITNSGTIVDDLTTGTGNDTVTNNGSILNVVLGSGDNKYTASSANSSADSVTAGNGNDTFSIGGGTGTILAADGLNKITVTKTGQVNNIVGGANADIVSIAGTANAVSLLDGDNVFTNSGTMFFIGIPVLTAGSGADKVTNSGTIIGNVDFGGGANNFSNTKILTGNATFGTEADIFKNSGTLSGNVDLSDGLNTFSNSGTIDGDVTFGSGDDKFTNTKVINGTVDFGEGTHVVTHGGSSNNLYFGSGNDKVTNSGETTEVQLGGGDNVFSNSGVISRVSSGSGVDTVTNTGTLKDYADLGSGNDKYVGGNFLDRVLDANGSDSYELRGGDDLYYANPTGGDGFDKVDGGTGIDTYFDENYVFSGTGGGLNINIDTISHAEEFGSVSAGFFSVNYQANSASGGAGNDTVIGFENVTGRAGLSTHDTIFGSAVANVLRGNGGNDGLFGYGGNDTLEGGAGEDFLCGGAGADKLTGGTGVDWFIYQNVTDSGPLKAARDTIFDFEDGQDVIHLSAIDAWNDGNIGNEQFFFLGSNVAFLDIGDLRVVSTASGWIIEGDVTGDTKADFAIDVVDTDHSITWSAADFTL